LAILAKQNEGQAIENKQLREMIDFAAPMLSRTYDPLAKPFVSPGEMNRLCFAGFQPGREAKIRAAKSTAASRAYLARIARLCATTIQNGAVKLWNR
jgi:hypothetical protein